MRRGISSRRGRKKEEKEKGAENVGGARSAPAPSDLSGGEMQRQDQEVVQDPGGVEDRVRVLDARQGSGSEEEKYVWTARGFGSKGTSR